MSLYQQYKIELTKSKKEFKEVQISIGTLLNVIAGLSNPYFVDVEDIEIAKLKVNIKNLEEAIEKALALQKKIKNLEKELE